MGLKPPASLGEALGGLLIYLVAGVAPVSAVLLLGCLCGVHVALAAPQALQAWATAEVLFYSFYWVYLGRLSPDAVASPTVRLSVAGRRVAMDRTLAACGNFNRFISGWFKFVPVDRIRMENAREWVAWSMFGGYPQSLSPAEQQEMAGFVAEFESAAGIRFAPGHNAELTNGSMRINLDAITAQHRPLLSYAVTYAAHAVGWVVLRRMGFTLDTAGELSYWHRPPTAVGSGTTAAAAAAPPVVLLHGIGLGLVPYLPFLSRLCRKHGGRSHIICPEFPHISQRFCPRPPSSAATASAIRTMLCRHAPAAASTGTAGHGAHGARSPSPAGIGCEPRAACFIGHSYGSIVTSWLVARVPECVGSILFLDPVSLMLQEPDISYPSPFE